jgi:hypothetical protein
VDEAHEPGFTDYFPITWTILVSVVSLHFSVILLPKGRFGDDNASSIRYDCFNAAYACTTFTYANPQISGVSIQLTWNKHRPATKLNGSIGYDQF